MSEKSDKNEIRKKLLDKINSIEGNNELQEIMQKVNEVNGYLDSKDTKLENLIDSLALFFTSDQKGKIRKVIDDILDKYNKTKKNGEPFYSSEDKQRIQKLLQDINDICDKNFWDRFVSAWRIGS